MEQELIRLLTLAPDQFNVGKLLSESDAVCVNVVTLNDVVYLASYWYAPPTQQWWDDLVASHSQSL